MNKFKEKKCIPLIGFIVAISVFYLFFWHFIFKSDDGHFIGIVNDVGFSTFKWLSYRYNSISGRSICEFLTVFFLQVNPFWWKVFSIVTWVALLSTLLKVVSGFCQLDFNRALFVCSLPFCSLITCITPGAFWYSGAFTYLVPFTFFVVSVSPLIYELVGVHYCKPFFVPVSCVMAFCACSQEQTAALTLGFLVVLIFISFVKKCFKFYHLLPLAFATVETYFLFSAPGMSSRMSMEASSFDNFSKMSMISKFLCGFLNYFAFQFLTSVFVSGLFCVLLTLTLKRFLRENRRILIGFVVVWVTVVVVVNGLCLATGRGMPDKAFERAFQSGTFDWVLAICMILSVVLVLLVISVICFVIAKERRTGVAVLLCFLSGMSSGVILGFSSSVYASGQRVFFFSEFLMLIACAILFANLNSQKHIFRVGNVVFIVSVAFYFLTCLSFALLETPIMG